MRLKVVERRLGRENWALGQVVAGENVIEIDPRQTSRERIDTLIHEALHILLEDGHWNEDRVDAMANAMSEMLWTDGWRRTIP